jgi:hypothetical protein
MPDSKIPDRQGNVNNWTKRELTLILLRQFRRLLADSGVEFSDDELKRIATAVETGDTLPPISADIRITIGEFVAESVDFLAGWDLTYAASLATDMNDLSHLWESTADFLDVANHKSNAELRISAGSTLLALLGDGQNAGLLLDCIEHDRRVHGDLDVDALMAKRGLLHISGVDEGAADWLDQVRAWLAASG